MRHTWYADEQPKHSESSHCLLLRHLLLLPLALAERIAIAEIRDGYAIAHAK
jgi:hypothetical protein